MISVASGLVGQRHSAYFRQGWAEFVRLSRESQLSPPLISVR
jgi:hypothetical protein